MAVRWWLVLQEEEGETLAVFESLRLITLLFSWLQVEKNHEVSTVSGEPREHKFTHATRRRHKPHYHRAIYTPTNVSFHPSIYPSVALSIHPSIEGPLGCLLDPVSGVSVCVFGLFIDLSCIHLPGYMLA